MISRSTLPQPPSPATGYLLTDAISSPSTPSSEPPSSPNPQIGRSKPSPQLSRWSRARSIRSGRKLNRRQIQLPNRQINDPDSPISGAFDSSDGNGSDLQALSPASQGGIDGDCLTDVTVPGKSIYMLSDGTGWTVEHAVNAALGQFEHCLVDRVSPVNTHLFSGIDGVDRLMEIIARAAKEAAMVVYTLADSSMAEAALQACRLWGVASLDVLSPITESIASHLGVSPSGLPRWAPGRRPVLGEEYFRRIEAVEFTIKQDDGALPENLGQADLVLTGVSRTGKTPLSIYLAQKGYKVANVPLVVGVGLPAGLFVMDPEKVFALTIDPLVLHTIRRTRARSLGFDEGLRRNYCDMDCVREESEFASRIFEQNPIWPVIEVTGRAVEETAAIILRLYHDRKNRCSMPRISRRY